MARDRKRAKDRKRRQANSGDPSAKGDLHRSNEPGSTEHSSGAADEVDALIIAGADGQVAPDGAMDEVQGVEHPEELTPEQFAELEDDVDAAELDIERTGAVDAELERDHAHRAEAHQIEAPKQGGPRFVRFLRASWAELRRVQWPDRAQVTQATAVVIGFVVIAGAFLGVADYIAKKFVDLIL